MISLTKNGDIQARRVLGKFAIEQMRLSSDRKWLAIEKHPVGGSIPVEIFDVGVCKATVHNPTTIPSCSQMPDNASGGTVVAVVRDKQIEVWNVATTKKRKAAPFKSTRIDAAQYSPDGKLLAISDRNELVLWRWEADEQERVDLGHCVGSLTFSPDSKFLAAGPTPQENIQIRNMETRKIAQILSNCTKRSMNVPRIAYTHGGRVLVACDNISFAKEIAVPHRINRWDTNTAIIAHQIALPAGLPSNIDLSLSGRYLAAMLDGGDAGVRFSVWRLDVENPGNKPDEGPPAAVRPR